MIKNPLGSEFFQTNIDSALQQKRTTQRKLLSLSRKITHQCLTVKKISMGHWLFIEYQPPPRETLRFFPSKERKLSEEFTC